jgi:hypothetical protein
VLAVCTIARRAHALIKRLSANNHQFASLAVLCHVDTGRRFQQHAHAAQHIASLTCSTVAAKLLRISGATPRVVTAFHCFVSAPTHDRISLQRVQTQRLATYVGQALAQQDTRRARSRYSSRQTIAYTQSTSSSLFAHHLLSHRLAGSTDTVNDDLSGGPSGWCRNS